jgi:hypothetical protein
VPAVSCRGHYATQFSRREEPRDRILCCCAVAARLAVAETRQHIVRRRRI